MKAINKLNVFKAEIVFAMLCFFGIDAAAQFRPVKLGDTVPDLLFREVTNYSKPSLKLSEFRGKYVILDFWGPTCISCLKSFPKVDSIQKALPKDLQIIAVSQKSNRETLALFKRLKNLYLPAVPFVNADTALQQMFPHIGKPHQVWLGRDGKVINIGNSYNFAKDSLTKFIADGKLDLSEENKKTIVETLLDERFISDLGMASYIYKKGMNNFVIRPKNVKKGFYDINSIANLFGRAFDMLTNGQYSLLKPGRIVLEVADPTRYQYQKSIKGRAYVDWSAENAYIYQSIVPENSKINLSKMMLEDLERYFNVFGVIEKKPIKTVTLVRTSKVDKLKTAGSDPVNTLLSTSAKSEMDAATVRKLSNIDYSLFSSRMKGIIEYNLRLPFKDLTGYVGNIDIVLDGKAMDQPTLANLRIALKKYDLDLVEQDVVTDVLVLREKK